MRDLDYHIVYTRACTDYIQTYIHYVYTSADRRLTDLEDELDTARQALEKQAADNKRLKHGERDAKEQARVLEVQQERLREDIEFARAGNARIYNVGKS